MVTLLGWQVVYSASYQSFAVKSLLGAWRLFHLRYETHIEAAVAEDGMIPEEWLKLFDVCIDFIIAG